MYFVSFTLLSILLGGVTTRLCGYAHLDLIIFMFMLHVVIYIYHGDKDVFGWYIVVCGVVWPVDCLLIDLRDYYCY